MARLLVANTFNEDIAGNHGKTLAHNRGQRMFWFAEDGDLIVLPQQPDEEFLEYATGLIRVRPDSLRFIVPPEGGEGWERLTGDRLTNSDFHEEIRAAAAGDGIEEILAFWPDPSVAALAESLGIEDRLAGYEFLRQGGGLLTNSKAVFRVLAAAVGMPIARGAVHTNLRSATDSALRLIADGVPLMLKQEYLSSGSGNYLLSPYEGVYPRGAREMVVVTDEDQVREYVAGRWDALTAKGRNRVVVEEYHPDSASVFAEFLIGDDGPELRGTGEMVYAPHGVGEIMPLPAQPPGVTEHMVECGRRLAQMAHSMGHRGYFSSDAIVTPEGRVLFTECNGRTSGSTHIYEIIGKKIIGGRYGHDRIILERTTWKVPSFAETLSAIRDADLAYDREEQKGVVLTTAFEPYVGDIAYCVAASDLAEATRLSEQAEKLFASSHSAVS
ncbi:peptide ligase PGM1-related protein [Streptosporangium sandarakinum]|uniref:preATP grasp domain-containing protein n=1 Tax=Streptosporangium sandarakinum TaxID=1260955 RepID=UPI00344262C1